MTAGTIIGISSTVFIGLAVALLWAVTAGLYNKYRQQSFWKGALAGLATVVVGMLALTAIINLTSGGDGEGSRVEAGAQKPEADPEVELDEDEDGLVDAVDKCPYEAGAESSGCPDRDGDGLLDKRDRCLEEAAMTADGCPVRPRVSGLIEYAEYNYEKTENSGIEQITVAGIIDPRGVRMQVGGAAHSAAFTVAINRAFQWLSGRVGIASEPCSAGSVAYVDIRDADGQQLWPKNGRPKEIHRDAVPFKVRIASEDAAVLYAEAPEAQEGYCGDYYNTTEVGWVHAELIAE